ncbi:hypothetical protein LRX77_04100 [Pseudoclavibacter sp. 13-3]|nr:DUF6541 family protein [Pseudoclavibacter sp. 13-3]MCD7101223.1 hypothetical protein [Pseudoclavibacter sp. 13-3]
MDTFPGLVLGAGVIGLTVGRVIGDPENFAQRFDNIFHLNAIRYILDTGDASPLWIGTLVSGDTPPGFYPSGWHALVALLVSASSGVSIPAAVNVATILICGLVWAGGVVFLGQVVAGPRLVVGICSGIAAAAFSAFPLFFLEWGTLYPNLYGFSFMPAVMALTLVICGLTRVQLGPRRIALTLLLLSVPGLALVHPSALLFSALLMSIAGVFSLFRRYPGLDLRQKWVHAFAAVTIVLLFSLLWWKLRTPVADSSRHQGRVTMAQGFGEWLGNAPVGHAFALVVSFAVLWGGWKAWTLHRRVLVLWWAATGVMYVFTASFDPGLQQVIREILTGGFYTDQYRVAALTAITAVPLAILGLVSCFDAVTTWSTKIAVLLDWIRPAAVKALALTILAILTVGLTQIHVVQATAGKVTPFFRNTGDAEILTGDERAVLEKVGDLVPQGATIIVNPGTGAAFAYALADRRVTESAILNIPTEQEQVLRRSLDDIDSMPAVCQAVRSLQAYYVLDFGNGNTLNTTFANGYEGFEDLTSSDFQTLYQMGSARLLRIEGC